MRALICLVLSVLISHKYVDGYWVVGPVFGLAVLICNWEETRKNMAGSAAFLLASTFIYALVYRIARMGWGDDSALFEYVIGPFPVGVVVGSVLLPFAHQLLLGKRAPLVMQGPLLLIAGFYFVTLLAYLCDTLRIEQNIPWSLILVAVWQGTYLWHYTKSRSR